MTPPPSPGTDAPLSPPIALHLVPVGDFGGVARHVLDLARAGVPGWRLVVLCPEGPFAQALREAGAAVQTAPFGPDAGLAASLRALRAAVRALRPRVVHSHLAYADIVSALAWLPEGVRRVSTEHGIAGDDAVYHESGAKARVMAAAHSLRQRRFAARIAVSEATAEAMREKWRVRRRIVVIPNGVDAPPTAARREVDPAAPRLLSLSRLAPEKRLDQLLEAFALLRRDAPGATLVLAGSGPLEAELRERVARMGLDDAVRLPGFVDAAAAMAEADAVVQLSVWENCSYTLLDAVARGLPVVVSRVGGNPEFAPAESLVDADDPEAVAARIRAVLAAASEPSAPMSVAEMARRTGVVYDRVGEGARRSADARLPRITDRRVISLADSPRREAFFAQPQAVGLRVFDAFDGRTGAGHDRFDVAAFEERYERAPKGGEIGCAISHLELLREFAEQQGDPRDVLLVAEDDAVLVPEFSRVIARVCERTVFDAVVLANPFENINAVDPSAPVSKWIPHLSLFARMVGDPPRPWRHRVGETPSIHVGTGLYLVTRESAVRMVEFADAAGRLSWVADDYLAWHEQAGLRRVLVVRPGLCGWLGGSEISPDQPHFGHSQPTLLLSDDTMLGRLQRRLSRHAWANRIRGSKGALRATLDELRQTEIGRRRRLASNETER